jgi:hypothetical protein
MAARHVDKSSGGTMNWFTNATAVQLWTIGLCAALTLVVVSLAAIYVYMRKHQPIEEEDDLRKERTLERMAQLANLPALPQRRSA